MTFDPSEQRDAHGRWTRGADGGSDNAVERHLIDPRVVDVSGDDWNKKTAERLEKEYAAVRPDIDAIAQAGVDKGANVTMGGHDEEDDTPITPESWSDLSNSQQEEAEQHYIDSHIDQEKEYAQSNWTDNGDPIYEAKHQLADDEDFKSEWLSTYLSARDEDGDPRIPFNVGDLLGAIQIKPGDSYDDDPEIEFDEKYLDKPDNLPNEGQLQLPGIEPQKGADFLTDKMREEITKDLITAFNEEAKSRAENMDPPDYLNEQAHESVQEAWGSMDEDEQFKYAQEHVDSLKDAEHNVPERDSSKLAWPAEFDPLNTTSGMDYQRTQALAKYIADERGAELILSRTTAGVTPPMSRAQFKGTDEEYAKALAQHQALQSSATRQREVLDALRQADLQLWSGWKGSSTNADGRLLQVAASDELGGRIRDAKPTKIDPEVMALATIVDKAAPGSKPEDWAALGGPANAKTIIGNTSGDFSPEEKALAQKYIDDHKFQVGDIDKKVPELVGEKVNGFTRLPDVKIEKNGAASTTVSPTVANGWNGTTNNAPQGINKKESIEYANSHYAAIGGYEGVKAALRAKWETTQYLLDKADIPIVQAYRGINMDHKIMGAEDKGEFNPPSSGVQITDQGVKTNLADYNPGDIVKTQSGKTITKTANTDTYDMMTGKVNGKGPGKWEYSQAARSQQRVVLRTEVPRTAVVSIPAYGVNVKSEQEVVVVGTGWKGWDAWSGRAPTFEEVPMHTKADTKADTPKSDDADKLAMYEGMKKANGLLMSDQQIYDHLKSAQS